MIVKVNPVQIQSSFLHRIIFEKLKFGVVDFYHIKRHLNSKENPLENKGVSLEQGVMARDERSILIISLP